MEKATAAAHSLAANIATRSNFSLAEFLDWSRISRAHFYSLQAKNQAPKIWRAGKKVLISCEDALAWRLRQTEAS